MDPYICQFCGLCVSSKLKKEGHYQRQKVDFRSKLKPKSQYVIGKKKLFRWQIIKLFIFYCSAYSQDKL